MNKLRNQIAKIIGRYHYEWMPKYIADRIMELPSMQSLQEKAKLWEQFGIECSKCPTLKQARKYKEMMGDTNEDSKKLR